MKFALVITVAAGINVLCPVKGRHPGWWSLPYVNFKSAIVGPSPRTIFERENQKYASQIAQPTADGSPAHQACSPTGSTPGAGTPGVKYWAW